VRANARTVRSNLVLFGASLVVSISLWLIVQVGKSGEEAFDLPLEAIRLDDDLILTSRLPRVYVTAVGPKEDLEKVDSRDLKAFLDLSNVDPEDNPTRRVELEYSGPASIRYQIMPPSVSVTVERKGRKYLPVEVDTSGVPEEGFAVANAVPSPSTVELSGLKGDIDKIAKVTALIDLSEVKRGESLTVSTRATPAVTGDRDRPNQVSRIRLFDKDGDEIDPKDVLLSPPVISVRVDFVPLPPQKRVPIVLTWSGQLPTGYRFARDHRLDPAQVQISGEATTLSRVHSLETQPIDLTALRATRSFVLKLKVPKGVTPVTASSVTVTVYVEPVPAAPPTQETTTTGGP
jgi:YbbR domain-containing protein